MRRYHSWVTAGLATILLLNLGSSSSALAAPREIRREIREGMREIRRERREAIREIRRADSPSEIRREIREGRREVRRERRELRREVRREIRRDIWWNNRIDRWDRYREVRRDIRNARTIGLFVGILGTFIGSAITQSNGTTNDTKLEEAIQEFGYVSGAAFQCSGQSPQYEQEAIQIFSSINQLFGENRASLYANAYERGATGNIDRVRCGDYIRQFRDAVQKGVLNR